MNGSFEWVITMVLESLKTTSESMQWKNYAVGNILQHTFGQLHKWL